MKIKELKIGEIGTVECVLMNIEEKVNRNNGVFLNVVFSDGEVKATGKKWNTNLDGFPFQPGQAVFAEIKAENYNGAINYVIRDVTESSTDPEKFIPSVPIQPEGMFSFLLKTAEKCGVYAPVVKKILTESKEKLLYWAAGKSLHHNVRGGLLYHTYYMTKIAAYIANIYNKEPGIIPEVRIVNTELLVAAVILHDIGKLYELSTDQFGVSEITSLGALMGHSFIGADIVGRYARAEKLKEEDIILLQHMILAHHGEKEYGAAVEPTIPEAMLLHQIDMIDAQMWQFEVADNITEPGKLSNPVALGRVYRPTWLVPES